MTGAVHIGPSGLAAFEGRWRLRRKIRQADGPEGRFDGQASFARSGPGTLTMDEEGLMTLGAGAPMRAERRYLWRTGSGGIEVSFGDNRPFHIIMLTDPEPTAVYLCPPDRYEVAYDFTDWPVWRVTWEVEGPKKAYIMTSVFDRM